MINRTLRPDFDEIGFDELLDTKNETDLIYEENTTNDDLKDNSIEQVENNAIDEQMEFNIELEKISTDNKSDYYNDEFQSNKSISFDDLLSEIEQDVSYFDSDIDFSDSDINVDEFIDSENDNLQAPKKGLDDILKNSHLILGLKYYKEKSYNEAIDEFQQIVEIFPDFKELYSMLGNAYFRNNMTNQAMSAYKRVTELDPQDVDAYENIGVIYANDGEYVKAITEWEKILEIDPHRLDIEKNVEKAKNILEKDNIKV